MCSGSDLIGRTATPANGFAVENTILPKGLEPPEARPSPQSECRYNIYMPRKGAVPIQAESLAAKRWRRVPLAAIRQFARQVAERFNPDRIILFGSYAYGHPDADSDVDILV